MRGHEGVHRSTLLDRVLNGFALFVHTNPPLRGGIERGFERECRGWDTNPRTHTGPDLKPGAFDHLSHPCFIECGKEEALE